MSMKLEIAVLAGAESKAWLANFTKQVDRLEKLSGGTKLTGKPPVMDDEDEDTEVEATDADEDDEESFAPKKKAAPTKKAAASFDDEDEDDEAEEKPAKKSVKPKGPTHSDVIAACKAHAAEHSIGATKILLKKKFGSPSVNDLKPEQYATAIKLLTA